MVAVTLEERKGKEGSLQAVTLPPSSTQVKEVAFTLSTVASEGVNKS